MDEKLKGALLPEGLHDDLPPYSEREAKAINSLIACFEGYGYEHVKPPLIEFEESLLSGPGAGISRHMFRLMDPISQRMMGVRADLTTQVARIGSTRMQNVPRPLRLCYAGEVLRVRGSDLRPERQYAQCGVELIGHNSSAADAEIVLLAAEALGHLGVEDLSIDLTVPSLVPLLTKGLGLDQKMSERIRSAMDSKDGGVIASLPNPIRKIFSELEEFVGSAELVAKWVPDRSFPNEARELVDRLKEIAIIIKQAEAGLVLTIDPGESRGFEYQTGVSFSFFSKGVRGELGKGGRYNLADGEPASGFTLYMDSVMRGLPMSEAKQAVYLPFGTPVPEAKKLRAEGWRALQGLDIAENPQSEAARLKCSHILHEGRPVLLSQGTSV